MDVCSIRLLTCSTHEYILVYAMASPSSRKWLSVAALAIIIPISLLTTFKLTGIIPQPPTIANTIETETITWNMTRSSADCVELLEHVENRYCNTLSVTLDANVLYYFDNEAGWPAWGNDYVKLLILTSANLSNGFIHSLKIGFSKTDSYAFLRIVEDPNSMELCNLKISQISDPATSENEAYFEAVNLNQPKNCSLSILTYWVFTDKNNANHWITVTLEVDYFNETKYERVVIPIQLGVLLP